MKANKAEQQALITLLNRIYGEIRAIEEEWDIRADVNDYRPRIEYFHDAIRALTAGGGTGYERPDSREKGRLSVEFLAYDISMLRNIQTSPMKRPKGAKASESPSTSLVVQSSTNPTADRDERSVKAQLSDLYKSYAVLFVALLSDTADRNHYNRVTECNTQVEELAAVEQGAKSSAQKKDVKVDIEALAEQYVDDPELMKKIHARFGSKKQLLASEATRALKEMMETNDKEIKTIEKAHFTYVTSQLAIYEGARDVVKKMAMQGMNIVGNFVQNAVAEATRGGVGGRS